MGLGEEARRRLSAILADVLGEPEAITAAVALFLDAYLRRVPLRAALGLRAMVWALTWMPLFFVGVPLPADRLAPPTRARYLARWSGSGVYLLREGFYLLKAIALAGWAEQPEVRARLGLGPVAAEAP